MAAALALPLVVGCRGEPRVLDPRDAPPQREPNVPLPQAPIAEGHGRVVLEGTDGPMKIAVRADMSFIPPGYDVAPTRSGELCTTPCVADLPVGRYKLFMSGTHEGDNTGDTDTMMVREGVNYYVRAPGQFEPPTWTPVAPTALIILGVTLATVGVALASGSSDDSGDDTGSGEVSPVSLGLIGAGIALTIGGGIWSYDQGRGTRQEGATTAWTVPAH